MAEQGDAARGPTLHFVGVIRSPHVRPEQTPIQPVFAEGVQGRAEILPGCAEGLQHLEGFAHSGLLYRFRSAGPARPVAQPLLQHAEPGVFATRTPARPNPIGLSLVRLVRPEGCVLHLQDVDVLDGTPLLDIKPYVPRFDYRTDVRTGWLDAVNEQMARMRGRRQPPPG